MDVLEFKQDTPETKQQPAAISVKNVLYATDFSVPSEAALPYAAAICRRLGGTLHVAHILSDTSLLMMTGGVDYVSIGTLYEDAHSDALGKVKAVAGRVGNIPCRTHVRHGNVWTNLSDIGCENCVDLIVVGTHGRTGMGKLLLGSVAEDILRHAPCPVLTIGPKVRGRAKLPELPERAREIAPAELELQHIIYATNFTPESLAAGGLAVALAVEFEARLTLMHVIEDYSRLEERPGPLESGVQQLQDIVPKDAKLAYAPETVMEFGFPSECIIHAAADREADLIVIGAHPANGTTHTPWSTVHRVIAHANCPVLTVRA